MAVQNGNQETFEAGTSLILRDADAVFPRSRLGIEPLLYAPFDGGVVLGRTYEDIFRTGLIPKRWRTESLVDFLAVGTVIFPDGNTFFEGIYETPPGHDLRITGTKLSVIPRDLLPEAVEELGPEAVPILREKVVEALAGTPEGAGLCLSGGLDSSAVAAAWTRIGRPRCFIYGAPGSMDRELALETARALGVEPFVLEPKKVTLEEVKGMFHALETPVHGLGTPLPLLRLFTAMAGEGVKIVLSGQGGDELFCGYAWHFPLAMKKLRERDPEEAARLEAIHEKNPPYGRMDLRLIRRHFTRTSSWVTLNDGGACAALGLTREDASERNSVRWFAPDFEDWDVLRRHDLTVRTLRYLLHYDHRLAYHLGLEARSPLLDDGVVDLVSRFRLDFLYGEGLLKHPIRHLFPEIPEKVRFNTRKTGFWYHASSLPDMRPEVRRMVETTPLGRLVAKPEALQAMNQVALYRFFSLGTLMESNSRLGLDGSPK